VKYIFIQYIYTKLDISVPESTGGVKSFSTGCNFTARFWQHPSSKRFPMWQRTIPVLKIIINIISAAGELPESSSPLKKQEAIGPGAQLTWFDLKFGIIGNLTQMNLKSSLIRYTSH
jgi:hypothetical protein